MRRRLLLLGGFTIAVAIAVLLRTAAPDSEVVAESAGAEPEPSAITELASKDCSISPESAPSLAGYEVAQLFPLAPTDGLDIAVSVHADERNVAFLPEIQLKAPKSATELFRDTIRPPPTTHIF